MVTNKNELINKNSKPLLKIIIKCSLICLINIIPILSRDKLLHGVNVAGHRYAIHNMYVL